MTDALMVAILSFMGTAIGGFAGIKLIAYRIEQLEKKVEKHNCLVERMYCVEGRMKEAEHDITDLKKSGV